MRKYAPIVSAVLVAVFCAWYIVNRGISYREVIVVLLISVGVAVFFKGESGLRIGMYVWIFTLSLGYRTLHLTSDLQVHPSELLLLSLFLLLLTYRLVFGMGRVSFWSPTWILALAPFCLWGWIPALQRGWQWDAIFSEFRNFAMLLPLYWVIGNIFPDAHQHRRLELAMYVTGAYLALFGVLEYVFPSIASILPGFISNPTATATVEGFERAAFSFYGHQNAAFVCVISLPFVVMLRERARSRLSQLLLLCSFALQAGAIFIAGWRSMWLVLFIQTTAIAVKVFGRARGLSLVVVGILMVTPFLSGAVEQRMQSLLLTLEGTPDDSSGVKRWERATIAMQEAVSHPLGQGWLASGWVHSDFLQVAANLGVVAGLIFLGAFLSDLVRLWRVHVVTEASHRPDPETFALLLSFGSAGWILATQPMIVLPQTILPIWCLWALVSYRIKAEYSAI
jgi:hypothetical protein